MRLVESLEPERKVYINGVEFPAVCIVENDEGIRIGVIDGPGRVESKLRKDGFIMNLKMVVWPHGEGIFNVWYGEDLGHGTVLDHFPTTQDWLELTAPKYTGFVHLHAHSDSSALDGFSMVSEMVEAVVNDGQPALAVTDHGTASAHPNLRKEAKKAGIKPIFGIEANLVNDRHARGKEVLQDYHHLILWAENDQGLRNLWAANTEANREGFYGRPRMDWDTLARHSEGLLASTACLRGPLSKYLLDGDDDGARITLGRLMEIFPDRLYAELHTTASEEQAVVNRKLINLAREYGVPLIAVTDSHYPKEEDHETHEVWIASQTNKTLQDDKDLFADPESRYHLMTEFEVKDALHYLPQDVVDEAMANTVLVADRCEADLGEKSKIPVFSKAPTYLEAQTKDEERLLKLCISNWERLIGDKPLDVYMARFEKEFALLKRKGFVGYYLMVSDYVRWAKTMGILVGPGRGSGSGSLVAYLSEITGIDPIEADLMFERFLTEGRMALPDFDVDFPSSHQQHLLDYIVEKYGEESVVRVGTHIKLKNKGVVRDLARVLKESIGIDYADIDAISKLIEEAEADSAGLGISWEELWESHGEHLEQYRMKYPTLFRHAERMVGRLKSYGRHAAGVVISPGENLADRLPLRKADPDLVVEFDMDALEDLGLVKFDLLMLRTLDTIQQTVDALGNEEILIRPNDWQDEYFDDEMWDEIGKGYTLGVFQVETAAGTRMCKRLKPRNVADLADVITLIRPGPVRAGLTETYLRRRAGEEPVSVLDPRLEPILRRTFGCMIYQEQILRTCQVLAGYDETEADEVRKILGKKKTELVEAEGIKFRERAIANETDPQVAEIIWDQMAEFAKYSFNLAHAYGYAMLGVWCVSGQTKIYDWDNQRYITVAKAFREGVSRIACYDEETGKTIPGKVREVIRTTGAKNVDKKMGYVVRTKSNKRLEASKDHKVLTSEGWKTVGELKPGDLVASEKRVSIMDSERRAEIAKGLRRHWEGVEPDEKDRRIAALNAHSTEERSEIAKRGWENMDPVERQDRVAKLIEVGGGPGWTPRRGMSPECGHKYASRGERELCRWFHRHGLEHDSQVYINGRPADFWCQGVFIEYDGLGRSEEYFEDKFGDEPYVVVTDWRRLDDDLHFLLSEELMREGGVVTFEPVISITETKPRVMYDIVMEDEPHNFLADGVVVHNCSYLKTKYPAQFLTACMSTVDKGRIPEFIDEARRVGLKVLPPDVNLSGRGFSYKGSQIRYGFDGVKGIGDAAVDSIMQGQPYTSFDDFMEKKGSKANIGVVKTMAKLGAFDSLGENRKVLEARLDWEASKDSSRCALWQDTYNGGPAPIFGCTFDWDNEPLEIGKKAKPPPKRCTKACRQYVAPSFSFDVEDYTPDEIMAREMEMLGVHLTYSPFDRIPSELYESEFIPGVMLVKGMRVEQGTNGDYVVPGLISNVRPYTAKNNKEMAFVLAYGVDCPLDMTVFSSEWETYKRDLKVGNLCLLHVRKNTRGLTLVQLQRV